MRIVFAGTRDIAVPALRFLLDQAPDAGTLSACSRNQTAGGALQSAGLSPGQGDCRATRTPRLATAVAARRRGGAGAADLAPDVGVVASYAKLLPGRVVRVPPAGWLDIHPSLLPRHRGPSPSRAPSWPAIRRPA